MVTDIITPKPTTPWGSLFSCCRPSTSPSPSPDDGIDDEEEDECSCSKNNNKSLTFDTETPDTSRDSISRDTSEMSFTAAQLLKEKDYVIESLRKQISEYSPYKKIKRGEEEETKEFYMLELEILLAEVSSLQLDLKLGRKTIDDMKQEKERMESVLKLLEGSHSEVESLQKELDTVRKSLAGIINQRDELVAEKDLMKKEVDTITAQKESMEHDMMALQTEVTEITTANTNLKAHNNTISNEMNELLAENSHLKHKIEALKKMVESKDKEITNLKKELEDVMSRLFDDTTKWGDGQPLVENGNLKQQNDTLQGNVIQLSTERDEALATMSDKPASATTSKDDEIAKLQNQLKLLHAQLDKAEEDTRQLTKKLELHQRHIKRADDSVEELSLQNVEMDRLVEEKTTMLDKMIEQQDHSAEIEKQVQYLTTQIEAANYKCTSLGIELNDANKSANLMQEKLTSKIKYLEIELINQRRTLLPKVTEVEHLEKELRSVQKSLQEATK